MCVCVCVWKLSSKIQKQKSKKTKFEKKLDFEHWQGPGYDANSTVAKRFKQEAIKQCGKFNSNTKTENNDENNFYMFKHTSRPEVTGESLLYEIANARNLFSSVIASAVCVQLEGGMKLLYFFRCLF